MKLKREDLIHYFTQGEKPLSAHRIGVEYEVLGALESTGWTLPFHGTPGVQALLDKISINNKWNKCYENNNLTELHQNKRSIFLEPGGQIEWSSTPHKELALLEKELNEFIKLLYEASEGTNLQWLAMGIHPFAKLEDIPWVPKGRYQVMSQYFAQKGGPFAHLMMKQTASIQVSLDYSSESDAIEKFRLLMGLAPIFNAVFANSSIHESKVTPYLTYRSYVWQQTNSHRCGLIQEVFEPTFSFEQYADFLLSVPMLFLKKDGVWISVPEMTFKDYFEKGYKKYQATIEDWILHLTALFTETRLKQVLEFRSADSHLPKMAMGMIAFIKGLLYDASSRQSAWDLIKDWSWEERLQIYEDVPKYGLRTRVKNGKIIDVGRELFEICQLGLESEEKAFLNPVDTLLKKGKTLAEENVELFKKSPKEFLEKNRLRRRDENGKQ